VSNESTGITRTRGPATGRFGFSNADGMARMCYNMSQEQRDRQMGEWGARIF
jgi:hypothetical protein